MTTALAWAAGGTGFTFLMTTLGAASVFLFRKRDGKLFQQVFLGFAAGVMIAASVWSLLIPAIDQAEEAGQIGWIPAAGGFVLGVVFLMVLHQLLPHLHPGEDKPEGLPSTWDRPTLLFTAVTLHNIPEGMSVGLLFAMAAQNGGDPVMFGMAVALAPGDVDAFIALAHEENLEATPIAEVTEEARVHMTWRGQTIVDVSRAFLASNGAPKQQDVRVLPGSAYERTWEGGSLAERMEALVSDLNVCSNKGLSERFDSTIGAGTVLMPFGGSRQLTPALAMAAKLPVLGETTTASGMAWGFNPYLTQADPFAGSYVAVVESVAKLVASGFARADMYLTFQEYFEKLRDVPERWGKPVAAVPSAARTP